MKNIIILVICCSLSQILVSQNSTPLVKNNTELTYISKMHGQTRPISLTIKMVSDTLVLDCELRQFKGSYVILPEALEHGNELSFRRIEASEVLRLKPTETFFMISQDSYQGLLKNKAFTYNNTTYVLNEKEISTNVIIEGKIVDAFHVVAQIDETEMWILKNPEFPFIIKIDKNPLGINCTLTGINYN